MVKLLFAMSLIMNGTFLLAQDKSPQFEVPVHMTVTVEGLHGAEAPVLYREDAMVYQGQNRRPVTEWVALKKEHAGLDLFVLVDDSCGTLLGSYLNDLRQFIEAQPSTTRVGVAYTGNGLEIRQHLTADHAKAAKAFRLPLETVGGSPYVSVSNLIKQWPAEKNRREILIVSTGNDPYGSWSLSSPDVEAAIEDAQRANVIVYSIYLANDGVVSRGFRQLQAGNYLLQLSGETGGESYNLSTAPPVSFVAYLREVEQHLSNQYLLTFLAKAGVKDTFQSVKVTTEVPNAKLVTASKVYVPGMGAH